MYKSFSKFWKIGFIFLGVFVAMFGFRLWYGYNYTETYSTTNVHPENFFNSISNMRKNYATEKFKVVSQNNVPSAITSQKYEKTASIKSQSSQFVNDEKLIKSKTASFKAVIQYEQNLGQEGDRQIHLLVGVNPELFDSLYHELIKIGIIYENVITKVDKTNEYRELNAKKASIEKMLKNLNELKSKGGAITDFVALNEKILEIEERAQELGVELGNFDTENEFCTIKLSLYEGQETKSISLAHRIKVALEWTLKYFSLLLIAVLLSSLSILILLKLIDKLKLIQLLLNKFKE